MTDDNTTRKKANAVFFSVIMVISMAAVGFAAAPAAAVETTGDNVEITYTDITDGQSVTEGTEVTPEVDVEVVGGEGEISDIRDAENIAFGTIDENGDFNPIEEISIVDAGIDGLGDGDDPVTVAFEDIAPGEIADLPPGEYDHQVALVDAEEEVVEADDVAYASDVLTLNVEEQQEVPDERDADRSFADIDALSGSLVYSGQTVSVGVAGEGVNAGDDVQLRRTTGSDSSTPVSTLTVQDDDQGLFVQFNTENRQTDDYFLRGGDIDRANSLFEVVSQDVDAEFDPDEVDETGNSVSELSIESDLRNTYDVLISIDGFDESDYEALATAEGTNLTGDDATVDGDDGILVENAEGTHDIDFDNDAVEPGDIDVVVDVVDTDAEDTAAITVSEVGEGDLTFADGFVPVDQGDKAEITIEFEGDANEAFLRVGDFDDVGYQADIGIENNGEDSVTVSFNTYAAGLEGADRDDVFAIVDDDTDAEFIADSFDQEPDTLTDILATTGDTPYEMELGLEDGDIDADESVDVGDLDIQDRSFTDELTMHTVSDDVFDGVESEQDIIDGIEADLVQQQTENTFGDVIVHQLDSTGLQGIAAGADDLLAADGVTIEAEQTPETTRPNADPKVVDFGATEHAIIQGDESFYIAINADDIEIEGDREAVDGDAFDVTLTIEDDRLPTVSDEDEDVATGTFSVVDREGEFDTPIEVNPADEQVVTGTTNAAPGNTLDVRVRSASGVSPGFVFSDSDIEVQPDGTFTADELDFSEASDGNEFTVRTRQSGFAEQAEADGIVLDADDPEGPFFEVSDLNPQDVTVDQGDLIDVSATITNTGDEDGEQTVEFRVGGDTIADEDVDLDAGDDMTVEFTDIDTSDLEGDFEHGVFTDDDSQTGTLTVDVEEEEEPEVDDEEEEVDDEEEEPEEVEDDTPGFGAIVALVALIAAALLATRRRN